MNIIEKVLLMTIKTHGQIFVGKHDIQIFNMGKKKEFFVDNRTTMSEYTKHGISVVHPVAYMGKQYYYVCPCCCKIHNTESTGIVDASCNIRYKKIHKDNKSYIALNSESVWNSDYWDYKELPATKIKLENK